jgi:hypothetical protein
MMQNPKHAAACCAWQESIRRVQSLYVARRRLQSCLFKPQGRVELLLDYEGLDRLVWMSSTAGVCGQLEGGEQRSAVVPHSSSRRLQLLQIISDWTAASPQHHAHD